MSKLSLHFQGLPYWCGDWGRRYGIEWVKLIDPPEADPFPSIPYKVGRTYEPDEESNRKIALGAEGARIWFEKWLPFYRSRPYIKIWEGPNEPHPLWDRNFRRKLDEFTVALIALMDSVGLKLVAHNWSVGWPGVGQAKDFKKSLGAIRDKGHYLGVHEYSAPTMFSDPDSGVDHSFWTLRYRRTFAEIGFSVPLLITECGIDGGVVYRPKTGWKSYIPQGVNGELWYLKQNLALYDRAIMEDDYVRAAFIFTAGPNTDWLDFEVTETLANMVGEHVLANPNPQPEQVEIISLVGRLPTHETKKYRTRNLSDIQRVVIHHSAYMPESSDVKYILRHLDSIAKYHIGKHDWPGIGYHFAVAPDGAIYRTNPSAVISYHVGLFNRSSLGIVILHDSRVGPPTSAAISSVRKLLKKFNLPVCGHKNIYKATYCPGDLDSDWWAEITEGFQCST